MKKSIIPIFMFILIFALSLCSFAEDKDVRGAHKESGISCADCHETDTPVKQAPQSACKSCHEDTVNDMTPKTYTESTGNSYQTPIHNAHVGQMRCTLCHSIHKPSTLYCNEGCHHSFVIDVP